MAKRQQNKSNLKAFLLRVFHATFQEWKSSHLRGHIVWNPHFRSHKFFETQLTWQGKVWARLPRIRKIFWNLLMRLWHSFRSFWLNFRQTHIYAPQFVAGRRYSLYWKSLAVFLKRFILKNTFPHDGIMWKLFQPFRARFCIKRFRPQWKIYEINLIIVTRLLPAPSDSRYLIKGLKSLWNLGNKQNLINWKHPEILSTVNSNNGWCTIKKA